MISFFTCIDVHVMTESKSIETVRVSLMMWKIYQKRENNETVVLKTVRHTFDLQLPPLLSFRPHQSAQNDKHFIMYHVYSVCASQKLESNAQIYSRKKIMIITSSSSNRSSTSRKSSWINFSNSLYSSLREDLKEYDIILCSNLFNI